MKLVSILAASLLVAAGSSFAADEKAGKTPTPGQAAGQATSDRTPEKETTTPPAQTTKSDGDTSDRTPSKQDTDQK